MARGEAIILGSGNQKYEWVPDWLTPPANISYGDTHGLAQDSHGRIYVGHTVNANSKSDDAIVVFDEHGKFLTSWGARFKGGSHGLDVRKEGHEEFLYHCDIAHRQVVKTKLDGTVVLGDGRAQGARRLRRQACVRAHERRLSPNGDFYVTDGYGSSYIHQYDIKANYIRTFGGPGNEAGKVSCPHGLWLDPRGHEPLLACADRSNHRIQYFTLDGKHVSFVTDGMRQPCHFSIRKDVMLVPDLNSVVTLLDHDNKVITMLGDGVRRICGARPGRSSSPASSSTRTTRSSCETETSSSPSGCRSGGSPC